MALLLQAVETNKSPDLTPIIVVLFVLFVLAGMAFGGKGNDEN